MFSNRGRVNFFRNVVTAVPKARFRLWRSESLEEQRHPSTLVGMPGDSRERAGRRTAADAVDVQVLEEGGQSLQRTGDEDVQHIMVVLEEELQPDELAPGQGYKLTGLDTDTPELELACGSRWKGRYEELMGTTLFFQLGNGEMRHSSSSSSAAATSAAAAATASASASAAAAGGRGRASAAGGAPATKCTGQTELCIKFRRSGGAKRAAGGEAGGRPSRQQQRRRQEGEQP